MWLGFIWGSEGNLTLRSGQQPITYGRQASTNVTYAMNSVEHRTAMARPTDLDVYFTAFAIDIDSMAVSITPARMPDLSCRASSARAAKPRPAACGVRHSRATVGRSVARSPAPPSFDHDEPRLRAPVDRGDREKLPFALVREILLEVGFSPDLDWPYLLAKTQSCSRRKGNLGAVRGHCFRVK